MKELQEDIKELLQKIIVKAYEISLNGKYFVYVRYAGQVDFVDVYYEENSDKKKENEELKYILFCCALYRKEAIEDLQKALEKLEELEG